MSKATKIAGSNLLQRVGASGGVILALYLGATGIQEKIAVQSETVTQESKRNAERDSLNRTHYDDRLDAMARAQTKSENASRQEFLAIQSELRGLSTASILGDSVRAHRLEGRLTILQLELRDREGTHANRHDSLQTWHDSLLVVLQKELDRIRTDTVTVHDTVEVDKDRWWNPVDWVD